MKKNRKLLLLLLLIAVLVGIWLTEDRGTPAQELTELPPAQALSEAPADTDEPAPAGFPAEEAEAPALPAEPEEEIPQEDEDAGAAVSEDGCYDSRDEVALYIHLYGHLPPNYITKKDAEKLGWPGGSLEPYAPGCCIGGTYFGNYEGLLPEKKGRRYTECDIDTMYASSRGAKRIIFSNDGLIYYTDDHYKSFTLLYGDEG